jgi:hypothetical protein
MYVVALLFMLWASANLVGGDYVGLVLGVVIAAILGAGQYFWDELGGDGVVQRLKVPLAVGVMIAGLGVVALMVLEEIEIAAEKYSRLEAAVEEFPSLHAAAREALGDRKISIVEYHDIEQAYHRLARQRAMSTLMGE